MSYLCRKRFKGKGLAGQFNIPYGSVLTENAIGRLCYEDKAVCASSSEISHDYFVIDDDGQGSRRFELTQSIRKLLEGAKTKIHIKRWNAVMEDAICKKYNKKEHEDHWLWSNGFFKAPISDLEYILNIIKEA
jgi:hypothetical protein